MSRITFSITPAFACLAFREYSWRRGGGYHIAVGLLGLFAAWGTVHGFEPWLCGFFFGVAACYLYSWLVSRSAFITAARAVGDTVFSMEFSPEGLRHEEPGRAYSCGWDVIREVWKLKGVWFFFSGPSDQPFSVPVEALGPELQAAIEAWVKQAGGRVS